MKKLTLLSIVMVLAMSVAQAFENVPFQLTNNSAFSDEDVYIALVGREMISETDSRSIWINFAENSQSNKGVYPINTTYNTIHKDASDWGYGNIFTKLSDIKDKKIYMPKVFACRIFLAFKHPLYLHLFDEGGYAGVNLENSSDPNTGIRFEVIEFSWANNGLWINTTRVDAFMYPMAIEMTGDIQVGYNEATQQPIKQTISPKTGDKLNHKQMIAKWNQQLGSDADFKNCYRDVITYDNLGGIIMQASKISSFKEGGSSQYYFDSYINQVWEYFKTHTLTCNQGERGVWSGSVNASGQLVMTNPSWPNGTTAIIPWKPSTQDVIEGKGALANGNENDKALQAQFCGAMTRGIIQLREGEQNWGDAANYFKQYTYNKYVWFFHQSDVSYDGKTYAFAYDDTFDQSSTTYVTWPHNINVIIGGFSDTPDDEQSGSDPQPSRTSVTGLGGTYKIQGYNGMYWDCDGNSTEHNTKIVQWTDEGAEVYQQWTLTEVESGLYTISPKSNTSRNADMYWGSSDNRTETYICDATANANQRFKIYEAKESGYYQIVASYCDKVLEIPDFSTTAGEQIKLYDNNDQTCSFWKFVTPPTDSDPEPEPEPEDEKDYWVVFRNSVSDMGDNYRDLRSELVLWQGLAGIEQNGKYEGDDAVTLQTTLTDTWFGGGIMNTKGELPFGNISNYKLHMAYKTDYNADIIVKLGFANNQERGVSFTPIADGKWHTVELNMSDYATAGCEFGNASGNLIFSIVSENCVAKDKYITFDDVYYYKNTPLPIITTEITDIDDDTAISVYPNPATSGITINGADDDTEFVIYNLVGQQVITGQGNKTDVSSLTKGYYILKANNQAVKFIKK